MRGWGEGNLSRYNLKSKIQILSQKLCFYGTITAMLHLLEHGQVISSPGGHFSYRIVGPCCRLFDREQLPWPCCRLQWHGKEPSWRRIGRRFVVDLATKGHPTYSVEILEQERVHRRVTGAVAEPMVLTLYWLTLPKPIEEWWYSRIHAPFGEGEPEIPLDLASKPLFLS